MDRRDASDRRRRRPTPATASAAADLVSGYYANGDPVTAGSTGSRYFWTNTLGTIYFDTATAIARRRDGTGAPGRRPPSPVSVDVTIDAKGRGNPRPFCLYR